MQPPDADGSPPAGALPAVGIDFLMQVSVAYFVVLAIILATRRFAMPLQAAAGLVTLQAPPPWSCCCWVGAG